MFKLTLNRHLSPLQQIFKREMAGGNMTLNKKRASHVFAKIAERDSRLNAFPIIEQDILWHDDLLSSQDFDVLAQEIERMGPIKLFDEPQEKKTHWGMKYIFIFVMMALALAGLAVTLNLRNAKEEIKAAEGVADIAMALVYAKANREGPQEMNWSDPQFLNRVLRTILEGNYPEATALDVNNHFLDWPYFVRIFMNNDESHFLVVAQPKPCLSHQFIPKKTIMLDSKTMTLRKTDDYSQLNRLLANLVYFEGEEAEKISSFVKDQELIPLSYIASKKGNKEFAVFGSSDDFVYNAPRYSKCSLQESFSSL